MKNTFVIKPSENELKEAITILGMDEHSICCAYCGGKYSDWYQLRPSIENGKLTGYISEIGNLVPTCKTCMKSKGDRKWRGWIDSSVQDSPLMREIDDLNERKDRLEEYIKWREPIKLKDIIGDDNWKNFEEDYNILYERFRDFKKSKK